MFVAFQSPLREGLPLLKDLYVSVDSHLEVHLLLHHRSFLASSLTPRCEATRCDIYCYSPFRGSMTKAEKTSYRVYKVSTPMSRYLNTFVTPLMTFSKVSLAGCGRPLFLVVMVVIFLLFHAADRRCCNGKVNAVRHHAERNASIKGWHPSAVMQ